MAETASLEVGIKLCYCTGIMHGIVYVEDLDSKKILQECPFFSKQIGHKIIITISKDDALPNRANKIFNKAISDSPLPDDQTANDVIVARFDKNHPPVKPIHKRGHGRKIVGCTITTSKSAEQNKPEDEKEQKVEETETFEPDLEVAMCIGSKVKHPHAILLHLRQEFKFAFFSKETGRMLVDGLNSKGLFGQCEKKHLIEKISKLPLPDSVDMAQLVKDEIENNKEIPRLIFEPCTAPGGNGLTQAYIDTPNFRTSAFVSKNAAVEIIQKICSLELIDTAETILLLQMTVDAQLIDNKSEIDTYLMEQAEKMRAEKQLEQAVGAISGAVSQMWKGLSAQNGKKNLL